MDAAIRGDASDASDAKTAGCGGFAGTRRSRGVLSELERGHDLSDVGWLTAAMIGRARATARMHALGLVCESQSHNPSRGSASKAELDGEC